MFLAPLIPKTIGIVLISFLSNFKSLMSNGIVIAKTKKNRSKTKGIIVGERKPSLSVSTKIVVVKVQTIEIKNIFKKGTSLNEIVKLLIIFKGYKKEITNNGIRKYKVDELKLNIK